MTTADFPTDPSRPTQFKRNPVSASGPSVTRRSVLKVGVGGLVTAAAGYTLRRQLTHSQLRRITNGGIPVRQVVKKTFVATDGWVSFPDTANPIANPNGTAGPQVWPDPFAPANRNGYIFGFADAGNFDSPDSSRWPDIWNGAAGTPLNPPLAGYDPNQPGLIGLKGQANLSAPVLYFTEGDDIRFTLWNTGLVNRPDILDTHTIHWHGFPNQIPHFDGVPNASLSVPIGSNLVYRYLPYFNMAGTYMWHCHVSDAEHVHQGLNGVVFIRPTQNYGSPELGFGGDVRFTALNIPAARGIPGGPPSGPLGYVFNDGVAFPAGWTAGSPYPPASTAYDREYAFILTEYDTRIHWDDAHYQEQDFSEYAPGFFLMNGRAWPDTIAGNTVKARDQVNPSHGVNALISSDPRLGNQPWSSLIQCNAGERVVLRFSNLGYQEHSMQLPGIPFRVIGRDAKSLLQGRASYLDNPTQAPGPTRDDISYTSYRTDLGPAESRDLMFVAPNVTTAQVFDFYDAYSGGNASGTFGDATLGAMRTQVVVYPAGTLPPQNFPQQIFKV